MKTPQENESLEASKPIDTTPPYDFDDVPTVRIDRETMREMLARCRTVTS